MMVELYYGLLCAQVYSENQGKDTNMGKFLNDSKATIPTSKNDSNKTNRR